MDSELDSAQAIGDFVDHLHREGRGGVRVGILASHGGINEQAQVRIVNLRDVCAGIAHEFQFTPQDRHAGAHEIASLRIRLRGLFRVPHAFAQQRG